MLHGFVSGMSAPQTFLPEDTQSIEAGNQLAIPTIQNPAVVKGKGRPRGAIGEAKRASSTQREPNLPPLHAVSLSNICAASGCDEQDLQLTQLSQRGENIPAKRQKSCHTCHESGHNSRTCKFRSSPVGSAGAYL